MNSHDVRRLRACEVCDALIMKEGCIEGYGATLCEVCAVRRAGGIEKFMKMYPVSEWKKLTLGAIGVSAMRKLMRAMA